MVALGYIQINFSIGKGNDWLKMNLNDFVYSLDKNLSEMEQGIAFGEYDKGVFTVTVKGCSFEIVKTYLDPFIKAMKKNGTYFILNVKEGILDAGQFGSAGETVGLNVDRDKALTKAILLECSLKEIDRQ